VKRAVRPGEVVEGLVLAQHLWGARTRPWLLIWSLDDSLRSAEEAAEGHAVLGASGAVSFGRRSAEG
jgi:hypothetical protein